MTTENSDPRYVDLDAWPLADALEAMWESQASAVAAVRPALPAIARAIEAAAAALGERGRFVYVGAGTSGRIAVQDGSELPPTFDWPEARVVFAMAGGPRALMRSAEGAEDDAGAGKKLARTLRVGRGDVVIGVAASGTTPFTVAALRAARARGAVTVAVACNPKTPLLAAAAHPVLIDTGSEAIAGSTRMKAGTAQKIVLNLLSSGIMLRLGRVYRGLMVNMRPTNAKLRKRAAAMVAKLGDCTLGEAEGALADARGDIKIAVLLRAGLRPVAARTLLKRHGGSLRAALAAIGIGAAP
jgi:N-acetylmuramic acid 6-phosphate etherase